VARLSPDQCPFAERCYRAEEICKREFPPFVQLNAEHFSLCHFAEEVYNDSLAAGEDAAASRGAFIDPQGGTGGGR
jgi:hypothetical protein